MARKSKQFMSVSSTGYIPNFSEVATDTTFPKSNVTYFKMGNNDTIGAGIQTIINLSKTAKYKLKAPDNSKEAIDVKNIIENVFNNMSESLDEYITHSLSAYQYGYSLAEYVLKYLPDGSIGIEKIINISPLTISGWEYDSNDNVKSYYQRVTYTSDYRLFSPTTVNENFLDDIEIPINKLLVVKYGNDRTSPIGNSPLKTIFRLYQELIQLQDMRLVCTERSLVGIPYLRVPSQLLSASSDDVEAQRQLKSLKKILTDATRSREAGLMLPSDLIDNNPAYSFELLKGPTNDSTIIDKAIQDITFRIHTAIGTDYILLGQSSTGSFAMAEAKRFTMGNICDRLLKEVSQAINKLIDVIINVNNLPSNLKPVIEFESLNKESADTISKTIQRTASVGMLPITNEVVNTVLDSIDVDSIQPDVNLDEILTPYTSRAGDGMQTAGNGTSTNNQSDVSTLNMA